MIEEHSKGGAEEDEEEVGDRRPSELDHSTGKSTVDAGINELEVKQDLDGEVSDSVSHTSSVEC